MKRFGLRLAACFVLLVALCLVAQPAGAVCAHCDNYSGVFACYADNGPTGCRFFRCFAYDGQGSIIWTYCCEDQLPCIA